MCGRQRRTQSRQVFSWASHWSSVPVGHHLLLCAGRITAIAVTADGLLLATAAEDKALKVFDVLNFGE